MKKPVDIGFETELETSLEMATFLTERIAKEIFTDLKMSYEFGGTRRKRRQADFERSIFRKMMPIGRMQNFPRKFRIKVIANFLIEKG